MLDSWKTGERAARSRRPEADAVVDDLSDFSRQDRKLVEKARRSVQAMGREDLMEFIDIRALGGIGRNVAVYRQTGDADQLREALVTVLLIDVALRKLLG